MAGKNKRKRNNKKNQIKSAKLSENTQKVDVDDLSVENNESVDDDDVAMKRAHDNEDSDAEETPRKKKKKKHPVPGDTPATKGNKSIRQMKKEKHAQRQADKEAASKDQLKAQCITYLSQWKHEKANWKFMKIKQVWLFKNKFSSNLVPESSWKTLLEYFESAQGNIKNLLLEDANKLIKQMDEWTEAQKEKQDTADKKNEDETTEDQKEPEITKPDDIAYMRARDIIQCLH